MTLTPVICVFHSSGDYPTVVVYYHERKVIMDAGLIRAFQVQIEIQGTFISMAAQNVNTGLRQGDSKQVFYGIQNLIAAAANIAKACWWQAGQLAHQRKPLRDSIGISDSSPLKNVNMRNHFEHMDERIDRWWDESINHNIADTNIGPRNMIAGLAEIEMFRQFDPTTKELMFWGQSFNIQAIVLEVERIMPILHQQLYGPRS
jgi:hypothetical protein